MYTFSDDEPGQIAAVESVKTSPAVAGGMASVTVGGTARGTAGETASGTAGGMISGTAGKTAKWIDGNTANDSKIRVGGGARSG